MRGSKNWYCADRVQINPSSFTGVSATAKHGTELVTVYATDKDDNVYTVNRYTLEQIQYVGSDSGSRFIPYMFRIDPLTGVVYTNTTSFIPYIDGYFLMDVVATDTLGRSARMPLYVSMTVTVQ